MFSCSFFFYLLWDQVAFSVLLEGILLGFVIAPTEKC